MFQLRLFYNKHDDEGNVEDAISIKCSNCNNETGLYLKDTLRLAMKWETTLKKNKTPNNIKR